MKIYKNFSEHKAFKTNFSNEGIFGGKLLGIKSKDFITFYDWELFTVVRRIDVNTPPKNVYWSESGSQFILSLEDTFYLLQYNNDVIEFGLKKIAAGGEGDEDGIEDSFTPLEEYNEAISSGIWISSDCFVFMNTKG